MLNTQSICTGVPTYCNNLLLNPLLYLSLAVWCMLIYVGFGLSHGCSHMTNVVCIIATVVEVAFADVSVLVIGAVAS